MNVLLGIGSKASYLNAEAIADAFSGSVRYRKVTLWRDHVLDVVIAHAELEKDLATRRVSDTVT
jgi:hypothetical protein